MVMRMVVLGGDGGDEGGDEGGDGDGDGDDEGDGDGGHADDISKQQKQVLWQAPDMRWHL